MWTLMPSKEASTERSMKALILAVALLLLGVPSQGTSAPKKGTPAEDFTQTLSKATLEMYVGKQECKYEDFQTIFGPAQSWTCRFVAKPICTATVTDHQGDTYAAISTGHCDVDELKKKGYKYYVGEEVSDQPVLDEIHIQKSANDDRYDYMAFTFHSIRQFPVVQMEDADGGLPEIGTEVYNVNFSLGITKQVTEGKVLSGAIQPKEENQGMVGRYFVNVGIGPGASGSAIVDKKTHKIVGLVEAVFPGTQMATIVVPMGKKFRDFADDDSAGIKPIPAPGGITARWKPKQRPLSTEDLIDMLIERIKKYLGL